MSYSKRFDMLNEKLIFMIGKMTNDNKLSDTRSILTNVYDHANDKDAIYHAAWIYLYNETKSLIEKGCKCNKEAAKMVLSMINEIEEEFLYEQSGD